MVIATQPQPQLNEDGRSARTYGMLADRAPVAAQKRQEAWARIAQQYETGVPALEAFERSGAPQITVEPMRTLSGLETGFNAIVHRAGGEAPRVVDVATERYQPVAAADVCRVWDELVDIPIVGTTFHHAHGASLILQAELPAIAVRGDEVANRIRVVCPVRPGYALTAEIAPLRLICLNGLVAPDQGSHLWLSHTGDATGKLRDWLSTLLPRTHNAVKELAVVYSRMASRHLYPGEMETLLQKIYREPRRPRSTGRAGYDDERVRAWDRRRQSLQRHRTEVANLFSGQGAGLNSGPNAGSAWELWQAVAEREDHTLGRGVNPESAARAALFGSRAEVKTRAYRVLREISLN